MKHHVKATSAGSTEAGSCSRDLLRCALIGRGAPSDAKGSSAPSPRRTTSLFAVLALAIASLALTAVPAVAAPPTLTTPVLSGASYASVHVTGKVSGDGTGSFGITAYGIQYSTDNSHWTTAFASATPFNTGPVEDQPIDATISVPHGGTEYFIRLVASNGFALAESPPDLATSPTPNPSFTTLPVDPPSVIAIENASEVEYTTATAKGTVNRPANADPAFDVNCHFQYVTDTQFQATGFQNPGDVPCEGTNPVKSTGATAVEAHLASLTNDTIYHLRLFVSNASPTTDAKDAASTFTTLAVDPPEVIATNNATEVFSRSAKVSGTVKRPAIDDPAFDISACRFEYVTDAQFTATGFNGAGVSNCDQAPPFTEPDGETDVTAALTGLEPGTTYHLRLAGENAALTPGTKEAANTFTTTAKVAAPTVLTIPSVTGFDQDSAKVKAEVQRPAGEDPALDVNCQFEYVTDAQFNATGFQGAGQTECVPNPITSPDSGHPAVSSPVEAHIFGLTPQTTYHLRLTASNGGGADFKDAASTFTTTQDFPASAVVGPITEVAYSGAKLTGESDAQGEFGANVFDVSTDGVNWTEVSPPDITFSGKLTPVAPAVVTGLKGGTKYFVRLRVLACQAGCGGSADVTVSLPPYPSFTTHPVDPATVLKVDPVGDITEESATVSGEIERPANPDPAFNTNCHFEYVSNAQFQTSGFQGPEKVPCGIDSLTSPGEKKAVEAELADLKPGAEYHVRLVATNGGPDASLEAATTFTTTPVPATVTNAAGGSDGVGGYFLEGLVNPRNSAVSDCKFVYGPNSAEPTGYPFVVPCSPLPTGRDEVQQWTVAPSDEFRLTFKSNTTSALVNPSPAEVEAALKALPSVGATGISNVTRVANGNETFGLFDYAVHFGGSLSGTNLPPLEVRVTQSNGIERVSTTSEQTVGSGNLPVAVEGHVTGLTPDANYHFRLVVTNAAGTAVTPDQIFIPTLAAKAPPCGNEQLRKENNSLGLPECRAYEMVTDPSKEGQGANFREYHGGDAVAYESRAANLANSGQGELVANSYVATRTANGWETIPDLNGPSGSFLSAPEYVEAIEGDGGLRLLSSDLLSSVWAIGKRDGPPGYNAYIRRPDGRFELFGPGETIDVGFSGQTMVGASDDLSHLVLASKSSYPASWGPGVYEFVGTGNDEPRRVDVDNLGNPVSNCGSPGTGGHPSSRGNAVSDDGRVIVMTVLGPCGVNPPANEVWARVDGTTSYEASASQCTRPNCNGPTDATFAGSAKNGSRVYFTTTQQLLDSDTDQTNDVYACDIPTTPQVPTGDTNACSSLHQVSGAASGARVGEVLRVSDDGSTAYFTAQGVLAGNEDALGEAALADDRNLYVWHTDAAHPAGQTTFVAKLPEGDGTLAQTTPDGRYLALQTRGQLLPTDTDNAYDIYRYDAGTGAVARVSTNLFGTGGNGDGFDASFGKVNGYAEVNGGHNTLHNSHFSISDNGELIVFITSEPLSPLDGNGAPDAYLWHSGHVVGSLGGASAAFIDGSGQDVYIETAERLTPTDIDVAPDVYDVRVGGGFGQRQAGCSGEACQPSVLSPPPAPAPITSRPPADPGNVKVKQCAKGKVLKNGKCVRKPHKKHHKKSRKQTGHNRGGSK